MFVCKKRWVGVVAVILPHGLALWPLGPWAGRGAHARGPGHIRRREEGLNACVLQMCT